MILKDAAAILGAEILCCEHSIHKEALFVCASDMMSDVLAFAHAHSLLLTGLVNQQVIRTAEMKDIECVCFVRDKKPDQQIIDLAESKGIVVMRTPCLMFEACGRLYDSGLADRINENGKDSQDG